MLALVPLLLFAPHDLYQVSTYGAFAAGKYDGMHQLSELPRWGDFGLGTFNGLDGEMVVLEGKIRRISGFGDADEPIGGTRTPFAFVTRFVPEQTMTVDRVSPRELQRLIDRRIGDPDAMVAIRIDGDYTGLQARSFARQSRPYRPLAQLLDQQSVFPYGNASGTFVGFRMPKSAAPVNVPGYHFHFLTSDRHRGGHVLGYGTASGTIRLMRIRRTVPL